ncbi:MAG: hypothetical protein KME41_15225 [Candidatus Thiodiazotropha sp. (ex Lucina pensylvanica)]|nr:hypothetical protein [Candidatus Thiodiazotropha sp. (ex Lucina pensylvanica)]
MEKTLKEQNRFKVSGFVTANICFYILAIQSNAIFSEGWFESLQNLYSMAPAGVAAIIAGLLNSQIDPQIKAKIAFLRWSNPLPGSRAFSKYGKADPRVDLEVLETKYGALPQDPQSQNKLWYKLYQANSDENSVVDAHREFLLYRDMASLGLIFLVIFSIAAKVFLSSFEVYCTFLLLMLIQLLVLINAARHHGARFVTNVLALESVS